MGALSESLKRSILRAVMYPLDRNPAAVDVPVIVKLYVDDFWRYGLRDEDAGRVEQAFETWLQSESRFPAPADIYRSLPKRIHQVLPPGQRIGHHPDQQASAAVAQEHMAKWRAIAAGDWSDGDDWTDELQQRYGRDRPPSPDEVVAALEEALK